MDSAYKSGIPRKRAFYEGILISFVVPMESTFLALETYEKLLELDSLQIIKRSFIPHY